MKNHMKCGACKYEYKLPTNTNHGSMVDKQYGTKKFIPVDVARGGDGEPETIFACPRCGTLKIDL
jgi:DNA-directed RNA polymerase subunit M/transcription elongation factor TFIIS